MNKKGELFEELEWRGLLYQSTPTLKRAMTDGVTLYIGIDPTGDSLHIGHLMGVLMMKRFVEAGHKGIVIVGGGTSLIGDPSGKDAERPMVSVEVIEKNKEKLKKQLSRFISFDDKNVRMVDNADWLTKVTLIEFLREVGKYMPINAMMEKDSVKSRIDREQGLSYAEFSYQLLQAYDFLELFNRYGCNLQIGGSDQWGNIVQGVDLIRKKTGSEAQALSFPLIIDPKTGRKFGKTEQGAAIWLDEEKTPPFAMYQFLINTTDELAEMLMMFYSFRGKNEIDGIKSEWNKDRGGRLIQKELAFELVKMIHGQTAAEQSKKVAQILFDKGEGVLSESDFDFFKKALPYKKIGDGNFDLVQSLLDLGLVGSKAEAKRLVEQKGVIDENYFGKFHLIRKGRKEYGVVEL